MIYQRWEGSSTPGKPVSPWRKVNVLAIYSELDHEYRLSDPTAVVHNAEWLDLNTFSPVKDVLSRTRRLLNTWKKMVSPWRQFNVLAKLLDHTMNTHFLSPPQWHTVLTGCTRIPVHPRNMLYHGPQDSLKPRKPVLPWTSIGILAIFQWIKPWLPTF